MSAAPFPGWVMMERFVFRRDDDESFPDDSKAPIRVTSATSWNAPFRVAFCLAESPLISRMPHPHDPHAGQNGVERGLQDHLSRALVAQIF
ncbi:hypothetical protein D1007_50076 [Hordeum vulgare]|nr:hypothetical protein D1007_50076 [Hordeum vulgare]